MSSFRYMMALLLAVGSSAFAHPSDVSQLRVKLLRQSVEVRLTINLLTLSRIVQMDADHDQRLTPQEIEKAVPTVVAYLTKKVLVTVNETDTNLGDFKRYECIWPNSETEGATNRDASQRYLDFNFVKPWPAGVHDVWLGFQIFAEVGDQHTIQAIYQQAGEPDQPIEFTQFEPEYLYDTGWTEKFPNYEVKPMSMPWPRIVGALVLLLCLLGLVRWKVQSRITHRK